MRKGLGVGGRGRSAPLVIAHKGRKKSACFPRPPITEKTHLCCMQHLPFILRPGHLCAPALKHLWQPAEEQAGPSLEQLGEQLGGLDLGVQGHLGGGGGKKERGLLRGEVVAERRRGG